MEQRRFKCQIDEGTYDGIVEVSVDADLVEMQGNKVIENAAWHEWRKHFGPSIGMAYTNVQILHEI